MTVKRWNKGMYSSITPEWYTPRDLFDRLHSRFSFTLDPCSTHENAVCPHHFTVEEDGLTQSWQGHRVFMNPPYGRAIVAWVKKAQEEAELGALVVGLLPARVDTRWWHDHVSGHADIRFIKGRLKFGGVKESAPFPSALAMWWGNF